MNSKFGFPHWFRRRRYPGTRAEQQARFDAAGLKRIRKGERRLREVAAGGWGMNGRPAA